MPDVWPTLTVLVAFAPPLITLTTYGPDTAWGTLSSALSASGSIVPPFACVLGLALAQLLHLALSGRSYPLLVLPFYSAAVLSTYTGSSKSVDDDCHVQCLWHAVAVWALLVIETYVLVAYVRVSGWLVGPVVVAFLVYALAFQIVVNDSDFDKTDPTSAYFLRSAGYVQLLGFLAARALTAETLHGDGGTIHVMLAS